jgi:hypothetical protein
MDLSKNIQIVAELEHDWKLVYRLVAKVALGAGSKAFGDNFIKSSLASSLRDAMWSDHFVSSVGRLTEFSLLDRMEQYLQRHAAPVKSLTPPPKSRRVVMIPLRTRTAIFAFFGINIPGLRGFVVPGLPPVGQRWPIVIDDGPRSVIPRLVLNEFTNIPPRPRFNEPEE